MTWLNRSFMPADTTMGMKGDLIFTSIYEKIMYRFTPVLNLEFSRVIPFLCRYSVTLGRYEKNFMNRFNIQNSS